MNRLKDVRKKRNISQNVIAKAIGVSQQAYARYENGTREPKLETWKELAKFLGVDIPYLQGESDFIDEISEYAHTFAIPEDELRSLYNKLYSENPTISKFDLLQTAVVTLNKGPQEKREQLSFKKLSKILDDLSDDKELLSRVNDGLIDNLLENIKSELSIVMMYNLNLKNDQDNLIEILGELKNINDRLIKMINDGNN